MEWQPGTEKAMSSSQNIVQLRVSGGFALLNQNSRIQGNTNPHMEMTTLQVVTFWCHLHGEQCSALPGPRIWPQELCSSARKESWVLKTIFRRKERLLELRSMNSCWDILAPTFLIHQYQIPRTCPILNFSLGDLPGCQIQRWMHSPQVQFIRNSYKIPSTLLARMVRKDESKWLKLQQKRFRLDIRKHFLLKGVVSTGTGCSGQW